MKEGLDYISIWLTLTAGAILTAYGIYHHITITPVALADYNAYAESVFNSGGWMSYHPDRITLVGILIIFAGLCFIFGSLYAMVKHRATKEDNS